MTNNDQSRFGSFFNRVEVERTALRIVNAGLPEALRLHGLTKSAIDGWKNSIQNHRSRHIKNLDTVFLILSRLSARIDALADQSRVVFSGESTPLLPTDELLLELKSSLAQ